MFYLGVMEYSLRDEVQSETTGPAAKLPKFDSDEASDLRCDACGAIFHNLTQFMDHRNFECSTGEFRLWIKIHLKYSIILL